MFKKSVVASLSVVLLLSSVVPVFADETTGSSQTLPSQSAPAASSLTPQERADQNKARLQQEIIKIEQAAQYDKYLAPIRDLQKQEASIRAQIKTTRAQINQAIKNDRQAKEYDAILTGLNDLISAQDDIASLGTIAQTCAADWKQLKTDRQAKNTDAVTADLQKIQTDVQSRINALEKVLADLQKVAQDLNVTAGTPAPSSQPAAGTTAQPNGGAASGTLN